MSARCSEKCSSGEFAAPRQLDAAIDPPLEAICKKAMATKPEDRYATCRALADDIERWMADEPVAAFTEPFLKRLARWERRHKTLVHGAVAVLAITALGLAVIGVVISRERRVTEQAKERAEANAMIAEGNLQTAMDAVYHLLSEVGDQKFNRIPHMEIVRRELVDKAVASFEGFLRIKPDDPIMLRRAERVYRNAGIVHWSTGDFPGAKKAYGKAIDVMEMVRDYRRPMIGPRTGSRSAQAYRVMAAFLFASGHDDEAAPYFAKARGHVERLVADLDNMAPIPQREAREAIGWFDVNAGDTAFANGDLVAARRSYERAIDMLTPVANVPKQWHWYRMYIGEAHRGLARVARRPGTPEPGNARSTSP